jgi:hypothetical protein
MLYAKGCRVVKDIEVKVDRREICQDLGYEEGRNPKSHISSLIDSQLEESAALIQPQACYTIRPIKDVAGSTLSVGGLMFTSRRISPTFSGCSLVAIFVASIGDRLEKKVARLMEKGLALEAFIMESIGSVAVEKAADWLENEIRGMATAKGNKAGWRYSPGYCDWDITEQKKLFSLLDGKSIGVHLTNTCLMIPRKSISGIIGIGKSCTTSSACRFCNKKNCLTRREAFVP